MNDFAIERKISEGRRLSREGKQDKAITSFKSAADLSTRGHKAHYYLGLEMIALGMFEDALENLAISLSRNPNFTKVLFWRCFVLIILDRNNKIDECFEKADVGMRGHHQIYQFKEMKKKGYRAHIRPDLKSDTKSTLVLDTSTCAEVLGIGDLRHTPQLLVFLMEHFERVVVSRTVLAETRDLVKRRNLQDDPHVTEVLALLEAVLVEVKASPSIVNALIELYDSVISEMCAACRAWWSAKSREKAKTVLPNGQVILPEVDVLKALFLDSANDRMITAEAEAVATSLSCMVYLLTADFDIVLFAAEICEITGEQVMPVRPEQIIYGADTKLG